MNRKNCITAKLTANQSGFNSRTRTISLDGTGGFVRILPVNLYRVAVIYFSASTGDLRIRTPDGELIPWPDQNATSRCFISAKEHLIYVTCEMLVDNTAAHDVTVSELLINSER